MSATFVCPQTLLFTGRDKMGNTDEKSFREFYEGYYRMVYRVCFMYMKNQQDAEDAMQMVFTRLIEKNPTFGNIRQEKAWIMITAANTCKSLLRRHNRRDISIEELTAELPAASEESCEILSILMNLPHNQKSSIYLYYYEGYSCAEIAEMLGAKESTVRSYLRRGREKLKNCLGGNYDEE